MSNLTKYKLLIAYEGTHYSGWQIQPNAISIQSLIEKALSVALHHRTKVVGSSRTDSGVHALEQVAHFSSDQEIDCSRLRLSLNGLLPVDIRVKLILATSQDFHARFSAKAKIYRYYLHTSRVSNPFKRLYCYHLPYTIDLNLLKAAASFFIGEHDFTSFSNEAHRGCASRNAVRTISRLDITESEEGLCLEFEANGFLYRMVRNIMGTLLDVARGKIDLKHLSYIFEAKDRKRAGICAPPEGLFLIKVLY